MMKRGFSALRRLTQIAVDKGKPGPTGNKIGFQAGLLVVLILGLSNSAMATIETIKGSLTCFIGCNRNVVQLIAQGESHSFEVVGSFVDTSTAVQITGSGVSVSYGTRKHGSGSSIIVRFDVGPNAAPGERTVKMRYGIETNGPDTFTVRVVRKGTISQIQYRRSLPFRPGGGPATELVPATGLPLNQRVLLIVTGTKLDSVEVRPESTYQSVRVLPGATATSCTVEIEFTSSGQGPLVMFDAALSSQDMRSSTSSKFSYTGGTSRNIQYGGTPSGSSFVTPIIGSRGGSSSTFVDVAPRANMLNIFRRLSNFAPVNRNGLTMLRVEDRWCNGMPINQNGSRVITIPNPIWGVSNVGTADINTAFASQLRSGSQILETETVPGLNPGETRDFTFQRQNSTVRVRRFSDQQGCFASPNDTGFFFEDPPFNVRVNTNAALIEATANESNNSRNY
jgi:hypothetical protein